MHLAEAAEQDTLLAGSHHPSSLQTCLWFTFSQEYFYERQDGLQRITSRKDIYWGGFCAQLDGCKFDAAMGARWVAEMHLAEAAEEHILLAGSHHQSSLQICLCVSFHQDYFDMSSRTACASVSQAS